MKATQMHCAAMAALVATLTPTSFAHADDLANTDEVLAAVGFEKTGERHICLKVHRAHGIAQIANGHFVFNVNDKSYLNVTQSERTYYAARELRLGIGSRNNLCRNDDIRVSYDGEPHWVRRWCTLGDFHVIAPVRRSSASETE